MRVNFNARTGEVWFEVVDVTEAMTLTQQLQNGKEAEQEQEETERHAEAALDSGLTEQQFDTWDYLVQHEGQINGVTVAAVARKLHTSRGAAGARLAGLIKLGYVTRIGRGRYRAVLP